MAEITEVDFSTDWHDIPRMLRDLAVEIENGRLLAQSITAVVYQGGGQCEVFGWGSTSTIDAYISLDLAKQKLLNSLHE